MKFVLIVLVAVAASCIANPMPQNGKFGAEYSENFGSKPNFNVFGSQQWSNDRGALGVSGNHNRELGGLNRHQTNAAVQGKLDVFKSNDGKTVGSVFGSANQQWNSHAPNNKGYKYGGGIEHTWDSGKFGAEYSKNMDSKPNLNVFGSQQWSNGRGALGISANHNRELGGMNSHQTNAAVQGKLDVFKSNDGKTVGSVFGSANHQWNSHAPNNKGYEFGGKIEHTWG